MYMCNIIYIYIMNLFMKVLKLIMNISDQCILWTFVTFTHTKPLWFFWSGPKGVPVNRFNFIMCRTHFLIAQHTHRPLPTPVCCLVVKVRLCVLCCLSHDGSDRGGGKFWHHAHMNSTNRPSRTCQTSNTATLYL